MGTKQIGKILIVAAMCGLLCAVFDAQDKRFQNIDWDKVKEAFEAYVQSPTAGNATNLLALMPKGIYAYDPNSRSLPESDREERISTLSYIDWELLGGFERLVWNGDPFAIRIAFRMIEMSTGQFLIDWSHMLGRSIKANPVAFLEEAKAFIKDKEPNWFLQDMLGCIVLPGSPLPSDNIEVFRKEYRLRIKSLETVSRPDLVDMRDNLLKRLRDNLSFLEDCP